MRIYSYKPKEPFEKKSRSKSWKLKLSSFGFGKFTWKKLFTWSFRVAASGILLVALMFLYYTKDLPNPDKLLDRQVPESTKIYARDGSLLYEIHGEIKRTLVTFDQIPDTVKQATVAVEDKDFYKHHGIVITSIIRAALKDITTGNLRQGGSTITQQFVKNAILHNEKTWDRKIREAILSIAIESRFSKDQILQFYLNEIPYGRNAYGIEAASQSYFGKPAKELNLAESAYLAALPQSTTYYNPFGPHRDALDRRKDLILSLMEDQGYITQDQRKLASEEKVNFLPVKNSMKAPHFVLYVEDYLADKYGETSLEKGGLKVYTTLDPKLQEIAEQAVKDGVAKASKKYNVGNAALTAVDPKTGQVLAMVGGKDYFGTSEPEGCKPGRNCVFEPHVNVALSQRQPGSSFKPYVYLTAFGPEFKYSPATPLFDLTTNFGTFNGKEYIPHNYNGQSNGLVNMRRALAGSLNVPAVKTLDLVGVNNAVQTAHDLGITSPLADCGLSLVLGGCEVRLLDHTAAYAAIANEGNRHEATPILKVLDSSGRVLEEYHDNAKQVVDPQAAYQLISIMTDNNARSYVFGPNSPLTLPDRIVAAKTGTTQNWHDGWTLGFTPSLAAGVWAGNNDGTLLKRGADGVLVAAPIWNEFMKKALAGTPAEDFTVPEGIQRVTVDDASGRLPTQYSPSVHTDVFASYSVPTGYDNVHISQGYDTLTGLPASPLTPPSQISYRTCFLYRSEKPGNPNWEGPVQAWASSQADTCPTGTTDTAFNTPAATAEDLSIDILDPADGSTISSLPFVVNVQAHSPRGISRVDLSIDGEFYRSAQGGPFTFTVTKTLSPGQHTIAARAVDSQGQTADTSAAITYSTGQQPLTITDPAGGTAAFPLSITAESDNLFGQVTFYYQKNNQAPQVIGPANNISHPGSAYQYSATWKTAPSSGSYKIYAQSNTGVTSPKVTVVIP